MAGRETIEFYGVTDEYGAFSNFARYEIRLRGKVWPTSEHFFQAMKFEDRKHQEEIRKASSPMLAATMGRDRKRKLRRDWERVKLGIMREAVKRSFASTRSSARCWSRPATRSSSSTPTMRTIGATVATDRDATSSDGS